MQEEGREATKERGKEDRATGEKKAETEDRER